MFGYAPFVFNTFGFFPLGGGFSLCLKTLCLELSRSALRFLSCRLLCGKTTLFRFLLFFTALFQLETSLADSLHLDSVITVKSVVLLLGFVLVTCLFSEQLFGTLYELVGKCIITVKIFTENRLGL